MSVIRFMRRPNLLRSTAFRLALAFAVLFTVAFLISNVVAFSLVKSNLSARYDDRIREMYRVIAQTYADSDIAE